MDITTLDATTGWAAQPDAFDLAAEREAMALETLHEITPQRIGRQSSIPMTCADLAVAPVDADGRVCRQWKNSRKRNADKLRALSYLLRLAMDTNAQANARADAWARIFRLTRWNLDTAADRARQTVRRERRKLLLANLKRERAQYVPFGQALKLADLAGRTLHRHCMSGRIARVNRHGQVLVSVSDLRTYLRAKIAA